MDPSEREAFSASATRLRQCVVILRLGQFIMVEQQLMVEMNPQASLPAVLLRTELRYQFVHYTCNTLLFFIAQAPFDLVDTVTERIISESRGCLGPDRWSVMYVYL